MKAVMNIFIITLGMIALPISIYGSWLLYNHVQATELMWFIWWIMWPMSILVNIMSKIADMIKDKK